MKTSLGFPTVLYHWLRDFRIIHPARKSYFHSGRALLLTLLSGVCLLAVDALGGADNSYRITKGKGEVVITAGDTKRTIAIQGSNVYTTGITVDDENILASDQGLSFRIERSVPNRCPVGLEPKAAGSVTQETTIANSTDALNVKKENGTAAVEQVQWEDARNFSGKTWANVFNSVDCLLSRPNAGTEQLIIRIRSLDDPVLAGFAISIFYEIYDGYPAIRKWVEISNNSPNWIKLSHLMIDNIQLQQDCLNRTYLTPSERGAVSSIVGFETSTKTKGVILASEIPSALRDINDGGGMGYNQEHFEWVLGPAETFASEPVFIYGYSGDVVTTISAESTPLDRAVESSFKRFLKEHVGVASSRVDIPAPQWATWTNFGPEVTDAIVREQARIAAKAGFELIELDDGWQKGRLGIIPHPDRFPDLLATCKYVRSLGLRIGLWVSCFRLRDSEDLKALPDAASVPEIRRLDGVAMSFSSPWSQYYANQLVSLYDNYGATYFKQDFTNIKFGDFAKSHDSRSPKESLLRGLRGLLKSQDILRHQVPGIANQITHEIYWGTPGVPCDLAAVKHAALFHIPPNDYSGAGHPKQRAGAADWWDKADPAALRRELLEGCFNARKRFYLHRGLPLESIEYYGAATVNWKGSLTPKIQDRQVCSWLMGAPLLYAGDLASLSEENINRYRNRFDIIKRLNRTYDIYRHFQYSGVPSPTDTDWHWWGKLNENHEGAVVVIRGNGGEDKRAVNIPWVLPEKRYRVFALFDDKELGTFSGSDLMQGKLVIALPKYGQEILEIKRLNN